MSAGSPALWLHGQLHQDSALSRSAAAQLGVQHLVSAGSPDEVAAVRDQGLEPWLCLGAFTVAENEAHLLCQSLEGRQRTWFSSGCPSHPVLRQRLLDRVRDMAGWGAAGLLLDGIRFASPFEGAETFLTCTCRWCAALASDKGLSLDRLAEGLRRLRDRLASLTADALRRSLPGLRAPVDLLAFLDASEEVGQWLQFRADVISEAVTEVRAVLRATAPEMRLGAYVFTPSLAPLVGQDYARLGTSLDVLAPMIYRLGQGPACLASEVTGLGTLLAAAPPADRDQAVLRFLGLEAASRPGAPLDQGLTLDAVSIEAGRARARLSGRAELVPILWLDDPEVAAATAAALTAAPEGVSFFATGDSRFARLREARDFLAGLPSLS